jgi:hypothetical protein
MISTTPRLLAVLVVTLALAGACGDKTHHRGWTGPFDVAAAEALVAKCLPGAKAQSTDAHRARVWRLADPGPEGWPTFRITYDFHWKDDALADLANVVISVTGRHEEQTPDNSARFRAALTCGFAGLPLPPKVGTKALDLLAALGPDGESHGKRDGFDLIARTGRLSSTSFHSGVHIFGE